jgi:hypothetical protein
VGVVTALKQRISGSDDPAEIEAEIGALKAGIERFKADAKLHGTDWLHADTEAHAQKADAARREAERCAARDELKLPDLEARLVTARAIRQREALVRWRGLIAATYPRLRTALLNAAEAQEAARRVREQASAALGEQVAHLVPYVGYRGLIYPDLLALWLKEQDRVWSAPWEPPGLPGPARPPLTAEERAAARNAPPVRSEIAHHMAQPGGAALLPRATPAPAPPAEPPKPPRPLHRETGRPPAGKRRLKFIRGGTPLNEPGTDLARIGDVIAVPDDVAFRLVKNSVAIYDDEETK